MGKRKKAAKKPQTKKKSEPMPKIFPCLFCNHEKSVQVKIDKKVGVGQLFCKVCGQKFQCSVNYLSAEVDIYADWVDACDSVAKEGGPEGDGSTSQHVGGLNRNNPTANRGEAEEDFGDLIEDTGDDRGVYEGEGIVADNDDEF